MFETIKGIFFDEGNKLNTVGKFVYTVIILIIAIVAVRLVHRFFKKLLSKNVNNIEGKIIDVKKGKTISSILNNSLKYLIYFVGIMMILNKWGFNTKYIVGAAGVGGVALGFGAQSLVKDVISGIFIMFEGQYEIGDNVLLNNTIAGNVVEFGIKTTKIQGFDGSITTISNGNIVTVKNMSKGNQRAYTELTIPKYQDISEIEDIINIVSSKFKDDKNVTVKPYLLGVTDIGISDSIKIAIIAWAKPGKQLETELRIRELFIKEAIKRNIKIG